MIKNIKSEELKARLQIKNEKKVNIILGFMAILGIALIITLVVLLILKYI